MNPISAEGRYLGYITKQALEISKNGATMLAAECKLVAEWNDEKESFIRMQGGDEGGTARVVLTCNDGSRNDWSYSLLKKALGWDGKLIEDLQEADFSAHKVAFHVILDMYNGVESFKIDHVSDIEWTPGINKATGKDLEKIKAAWAKVASTDDEPAEASKTSTADDPSADSELNF